MKTHKVAEIFVDYETRKIYWHRFTSKDRNIDTEIVNSYKLTRSNIVRLRTLVNLYRLGDIWIYYGGYSLTPYP